MLLAEELQQWPPPSASICGRSGGVEGQYLRTEERILQLEEAQCRERADGDAPAIASQLLYGTGVAMVMWLWQVSNHAKT